MAKCRIEADERYPVFTFVDEWPHCGVEVEVDAAILERWKLVYGAWEAVQDEMREAAEAAMVKRGRQV